MKHRVSLFIAFSLVVVVAVSCLVAPSLARHDVFASRISNQGHSFAKQANYQLCFVPDGASCQTLVISAIDETKKSLLVQAYSFTSAPIASAVKRAKERGVDVKVILDKSQASPRYTTATYLRNAGIDVVIDTKPAIAHNKVMIFDDGAVFTGSFNFTKSAQERNAENGVLIRGDATIVRSYSGNWLERYKVSTPYQE